MLVPAPVPTSVKDYRLSHLRVQCVERLLDTFAESSRQSRSETKPSHPRLHFAKSQGSIKPAWV